MLKQVLLVGFVLASSSMAMAASSSVSTSTGANCSQNEDSGKSVEMGTELDTETQRGSVFIKMVFKLGNADVTTLNCNRMYNNEVQKQELELDKLKMQINLLKSQLNQTETGTLVTGDDW
tara:strand:- start:173 stop:532 length:360 start_codon:yes stop_codon:yes gene_type:complete